MCIILTGMSLEEGDHKQAAEWLRRAEEPASLQDCPELAVVSLVSYLLSLHLQLDPQYSKDFWMEL
jgi:hypothetical protein